ncbi:Hypothetical predicted protein [Paramuricea clavata]|uniref:Uncharacterized protein n=1 Tax=Paramuricea clavata TaxID=317549 RepID=A0A7D9M1H9_PARCT|nr:Hypothetical predicted protein [Paramuricea clavata]
MAQSDVVVEVVQAEEADEDFKKTSILTSFKNFCMRNYLAIGIILSIIIGIFLPQPAIYLSQRMPVAKICIIVLFLTIGVRIRLVEAKSAVKFYKEVVVGLLLVLFVGPIFATNVLNQVPNFGSLIGDEQNLRNVQFEFLRRNGNSWAGGISSCFANVLHVSNGPGYVTRPRKLVNVN